MNRFVLHVEPEQAARFHCDKHVVKMILEEGQMLSTVHRLSGSTDDNLYRATHKHHPCTVWAGQSSENYRWGYRLLVALCDEYTFRYGKQHATSRLLPLLATEPANLPQIGLTPFPQAMPDPYKGSDPIEAYRRFYRAEKARFARWSKRETPAWFLP